MLNFVQSDQTVETWSKGIHKQQVPEILLVSFFGLGGLSYRLTGHAYQESDQKKSTMDMTVDEEKKNVRNILGSRHIAQ